jgi:hypothetical protein
VAENPQKYDRARVKYAGQLLTWYEGSSLDVLDGVELEFSRYIIRRNIERGNDRPHKMRPGFRRQRPQSDKSVYNVRVLGVLHTQSGGYGHMAASRFLLRADEIDYIENAHGV